jgi:hydroxyethylthiazole kinase-like uncharacterized protein yjeF
MVVVLSPPEAFPIYATALTSIMVRKVSDTDMVAQFKGDRVSAIVAGPGLGVGQATRDIVLALLASKKPAVLDADALTSFESDPQTLFNALHENVILTPHAGEFARLFKLEGNKAEATQQAAKQSGAIIVHKGAQTIIASPQGDLAINDHASPYLATGGTGDVLAGMCAGLLAQQMPAFHAACAACWIHGEIGLQLGAGLIADDLPDAIPEVLREFLG